MNTQTTTPSKRLLKASGSPAQLIAKIGVNQPANRRLYRFGYEEFFNDMPLLHANDALLPQKIAYSKSIMEALSTKVVSDDWLNDKRVGPNQFERTIIAIADPELVDNEIKEGAEFVIAHWGENFSSPVHGHSIGYLHEQLLNGKLRVNTYRMLDPTSNKVRLVETMIVTKGTFLSQYAVADNYFFKRSILIHNFTALEPSNSLHYLPEHTRDGKDNGFVPEFFEDVYGLSMKDLYPITTDQGLTLKNGDVALVRSSNVPDYGDHYIVITGRPVLKEHGLRPQDTAMIAPHMASVIDNYRERQGVILLKLSEEAKIEFHKFHDIKMDGDKVIMPKPTSLVIK